MAHVDGVSIRLPGLTVSVKVDDVEKRVASEIVIRLADRRVLNSRECCDSCVSNALASLEKIRALLVDKQVQLSDRTDRPLYLLIAVALEGIRQFLSYEEQTKRHARRLSDGDMREDASFPEPGFFYRERYLLALEQLRAHIFRTLEHIAAIAEVEVPKVPPGMRYGSDWQIDAYALTLNVRVAGQLALTPVAMPLEVQYKPIRRREVLAGEDGRVPLGHGEARVACEIHRHSIVRAGLAEERHVRVPEHPSRVHFAMVAGRTCCAASAVREMSPSCMPNLRAHRRGRGRRGIGMRRRWMRRYRVAAELELPKNI